MNDCYNEDRERFFSSVLLVPLNYWALEWLNENFMTRYCWNKNEQGNVYCVSVCVCVFAFFFLLYLLLLWFAGYFAFHRRGRDEFQESVGDDDDGGDGGSGGWG